MIRQTTASRERILVAATTLFSRYGFKRTSMEDIASEAGLSRAALYLQFRNKEDIFREGARELHEDGIAQAEIALAKGGPLAEQLLHAVEAKTLRLMEITCSSPHGGELMDENNRLCGALAAENQLRFVEMLEEAFRQAAAAREVDLAAAGLTAREASELFTQAVAGLKLGAVSPDVYRKRLAKLVQVFVAGLTP